MLLFQPICGMTRIGFHWYRKLEFDLEMEGTYRDTRECAALAVQAGGGQALLSPPTPRPKKDKG